MSKISRDNPLAVPLAFFLSGMFFGAARLLQLLGFTIRSGSLVLGVIGVGATLLVPRAVLRVGQSRGWIKSELHAREVALDAPLIVALPAMSCFGIFALSFVLDFHDGRPVRSLPGPEQARSLIVMALGMFIPWVLGFQLWNHAAATYVFGRKTRPN